MISNRNEILTPEEALEIAALGPLKTTEEIARSLGVSRHTIYKWISQQRLFPIRLSARCIRFPSNEQQIRYHQQRLISSSGPAHILPRRCK